MNQALQLPSWALWVIGLAAALFAVLCVAAVRRNHGVKRSFFAMPYTLWMILFTLLPCVLIAYYALTDGSGQLTLDNFRAFWDSNHIMRENMRAVAGDEVAATIPRGSVNVDTLVYSLWMALFMADRHMKLGSTLVVLFIIPMWMNFLLRTIAWMSLLEDNGLINAFLEWIGVGKVQLMYNQGAVLLGMVYNFLPFMVFPIYTSLSKMDPKLGEAAMDLGCNEAKTLLKVTIPLSVPGIISGITMVFMPSVTTFFIPRVLGGGSTQMFGDLIETTFLTAGDWNLGSALSLIMMVLILISLSILRKADPNGEGGGIA